MIYHLWCTVAFFCLDQRPSQWHQVVCKVFKVKVLCTSHIYCIKCWCHYVICYTRNVLACESGALCLDCCPQKMWLKMNICKMCEYKILLQTVNIYMHWYTVPPFLFYSVDWWNSRVNVCVTYCIFAGGFHDLTQANANTLPLITLVWTQPLLQNGDNLRQNLFS